MSTRRHASDVLLCVGIVLTTATQFRGDDLPVGPGELLLVLWIVGAVLRIVRRGRLSLPPVARVVARFWGVSLFALVGGTLAAAVLGISTSRGASHDTIALALVMVMSLVLVMSGDVEARAGRIARTFFNIGALSLALLLAIAFTVRQIGPINAWYSSRFTGWSINPNQMALFCSVVLFAGLISWRQGGSRSVRGLMLLGIAVALVSGVLTASDALLLAWIASLGTAVLLWWYRALRGRHGNLFTATAVYVVVPLLAISVVVLAGPWVIERALTESQTVFADADQGSVRIALWNHGLQAIARSPVTGLGPGAHSGVAGPFLGSEAHNTLIDWGASSGLVGVTAYVILLAWMMRRAWRSGQTMSVVAVVMISMFSLFHYLLRHPVFWFFLVVIASLAGGVASLQRTPALPAAGTRLARTQRATR